jgi:HAD superfamily hydrolase (TIGR01490 family)
MAAEKPQTLIGISIFDLDRTITRHGTWSLFLLFAAWHRAPWRLALVPAVVAAMAGYKAGLFSRGRLKEIMQRLMIGEAIPRAEAAALALAFARRTLDGNVYPQAIALIRREIADGRRVMIASAAHRYYLAPLAKTLGTNEAIGTRSRWRGELLTPRIEGENCYGHAKCTMLIERLRKIGLERTKVHIRFYSDDISDLPTFDWADEAVAVNPSATLARHARASAWPILDWRQKARWTKTATRDPARAVSLPSRFASRAE